MTALAEHGIHIRREQPGEHRAACPRCAEAKRRPRDDALAVKVEPDGAATWWCFRCAWKGGLPPAGQPGRTPSRPPLRLSAPPSEAERRRQPFSALDARGWGRTKPILPGTSPADYLLGRGCRLPHEAGDLRWLPEAWNWKCRHAGPALVALITDPLSAAPLSLHFTWIRPDGGGKADIDKPRLYLADREKVGVVRLWPDEELTHGLCVGEGLETCLTAAHGFTPVWACLDAANLAVLPVLPGVEALTIVADHDEPNPRTGKRAGTRAAAECAERWLAAGREVRVWKAPTEGADFNDFAREAAA